MKTIRDVLDAKGHQVFSAVPDQSVYQALKTMADRQVGSLVVVNGGEPVGIVSERDYARKVALKGRVSSDTPVSAIMASPVICARQEQSVEDCLALMSNKRIRHLPVMEDGALVGVVSIGDLVGAIIDDQRFVIDQLEHYIAG